MEILNRIIIDHAFDTVEDLCQHIDNHDYQCDFAYVNDMVDAILDAYRKNDSQILDSYLRVVASFVQSRGFHTLYSMHQTICSLFEMLRSLVLIFKDNSVQYLASCFDVTMRVVEINKDGLKRKHFAYATKVSKGDLVYIKDANPNHIYFVTDTYSDSFKHLLSYFVHISAIHTYYFDVNYVSIADVAINQMGKKRLVRVQMDNHIIYCDCNRDIFIGEQVQVTYQNQIKRGVIMGDAFFYEGTSDGVVLDLLEKKASVYRKERRMLSLDVVQYLLKQNTLEGFYNLCLNPTDAFKTTVFTSLEQLIELLSYDARPIHTIDEVNMFYRPWINGLLAHINIDSFYTIKDNEVIHILGYLQHVDRAFGLLDFFIDQHFDRLVNLVDINLNGIILKQFAFDSVLSLGEPIFIKYDHMFPIAFVHKVYALPLHQVLTLLPYIHSMELVSINRLAQYVQNKASIKDKVICVRVFDGKKIYTGLVEGGIPYLGEVVHVDNKAFTVIEEAYTCPIEAVNKANMIVLD